VAVVEETEELFPGGLFVGGAELETPANPTISARNVVNASRKGRI